MNLILLTAGTGGFFCGSCMRDNTLARALLAEGHEALLVPLYSPIKLDEPDASHGRIFFGGLNVFLQQKFALFRRTPQSVARPRRLDRLLDAPWLLRALTRLSGMTDPAALGELMLSMVRGEEGRQRTELDKLIAWLRIQERPDVVVLGNVLLLGLARALKSALGVPVLCTLQGEDYFLDGLADPWRQRVWEELKRRATDVDGFIAVSAYYGRQMQRRLDLPEAKVHVVWNGIDLSGFGEIDGTGTREPVVGYLARLCPEKGLFTLLMAIQILTERRTVPGLRLAVAGCTAPPDRPFARYVRNAFPALRDVVEWVDCPDRAAKIEFLQGLRLLSVPATYGESFGLYILESLACGVPVVQPNHGAFPEILEATGGGTMVDVEDRESVLKYYGDRLVPDRVKSLVFPAAQRTLVKAGALADALERALRAGEDYDRWRRQGREAVLQKFTAARMARDVLAVCARYTSEAT